MRCSNTNKWWPVSAKKVKRKKKTSTAGQTGPKPPVERKMSAGPGPAGAPRLAPAAAPGGAGGPATAPTLPFLTSSTGLPRMGRIPKLNSQSSTEIPPCSAAPRAPPGPPQHIGGLQVSLTTIFLVMCWWYRPSLRMELLAAEIKSIPCKRH